MPVAPPEAPGGCAEMQAYDTDPLSVSEILRLDLGADEEESTRQQRSPKLTRSRGIAPTEERVKWEKKDVVTKGVYKPWFFTRFARFWIPLGKPQCAMDLKSICSAARGQARHRPRKGKACDDDSSDKSGVEEEVWVGCDECSKWRKVPHGFAFDKSKSFFCHMLRDTTCETPEEEWDTAEEFVDDADLIVEECGSSFSTPYNAHRVPEHHAKPQRDCAYPREASSRTSTERAAGKRKLISPRVFGAEDDDGTAPCAGSAASPLRAARLLLSARRLPAQCLRAVCFSCCLPPRCCAVPAPATASGKELPSAANPSAMV